MDVDVLDVLTGSAAPVSPTTGTRGAGGECRTGASCGFCLRCPSADRLADISWPLIGSFHTMLCCCLHGRWELIHAIGCTRILLIDHFRVDASL